ncbi:fimbrial biogenesis chaperone [Pseudomonas chlororaphis]|uniref:fimbrial biogenesis chaperone n=1 Tax=Pseudomonas chlororaphis TaxID=587753 RepID=UPI00047085AC|nr:molecular chaperone [Pseudomonas chlororaphis]AVO57757.1 molecular chaperone [Pseudomonas chlororaphis subsp. piscium]AZC49089.1 putative pili asembly chaperone [Pseudomonas chlororaphis subsp. piscium]AZC55718.1 putative pili asembly chaperone [Pseudomonas chlororaphis subsp. piscium]AZC61977.1 putative pili asembly chaperone [Pseudomonas chlororaphis subsp. piscium]AZC68217.1 putative pili asembly chaperone [Pseudomonas chlororaphis subsp. piscium]
MTPKARIFSSFVLGVMFLGVCSGIVQASVVIQGTRLVYPSDAREVTIKMSNTGASAALAQSWIDDGDSTKGPEEMKVPFLVSPAVIRLDPDSSASLRVSFTGEKLAEDRESLFWLNVLETPPRKEVDENVLQFTFRTRIKVFFRPKNLKSDVDLVANKLDWQFKQASYPDEKGNAENRLGVQASNPTAYYVSFGKIEVALDGRRVTVKDEMIAPFSSGFFPLPEWAPQTYRKASVHYEVINDFGGRRVLEKPLSL